jgi:serine protease AprX
MYQSIYNPEFVLEYDVNRYVSSHLLRLLVLMSAFATLCVLCGSCQEQNIGNADNSDFDNALTVGAALELLDIEKLFSANEQPDSIGVALLDSGIYPHGDLMRPKQKIKGFVDLVNNYELPYDDNGHGTAIAGIIAEVCGNAELICVKVLDLNGKCSVSKLIEGFEWVIDHKDAYNIRIVNVSIGIPVDLQTNFSELVSVVEKAQNNGLLVVASTGNKTEANNTRYQPADIQSVVSVGGADVNGDGSLAISQKTATWMNDSGILVPTVIAPYTNIISLKSDVYYNPNVRNGGAIRADYATFSGTSEATALVSGICAVAWSGDINLTRAEIFGIIVSELGNY